MSSSSSLPRGRKRTAAGREEPSASPPLPSPPLHSPPLLPLPPPSAPLAPSPVAVPEIALPSSKTRSGQRTRTPRAKKGEAPAATAATSAAPLALIQPRTKKAAVPRLPPPVAVAQEGCPAIRLSLKLIAVPSRLDELRESLSKGAAPLTFSLITRKINPRAAKYDHGALKRNATPGADLLLLIRKSDGLILAGAGHETSSWTADDMNPGISKDEATAISDVFKVTHPIDKKDTTTSTPGRIGTMLSVELLTDRVSFSTSSKLYQSSVRRRYVTPLKKVPGQKRPAWNDATEQIDTKVLNFFDHVSVTFLLRVSPYSQDDETAILDLDSAGEGTPTQQSKQTLNSLWIHSRKQGNFQLTSPGGTVSKAEALIKSGKAIKKDIKALYAEYVRLVTDELEAMDRDKRRIAVPAAVQPSLSASLQAAKSALASATMAAAAKAAAAAVAASKAAAAKAAAAAAAAATSSSDVTSSSAIASAVASASATYSYFMGAGDASQQSEDDEVIIVDANVAPNAIAIADARVKEVQTSYNAALAAAEVIKARDDALIVNEGLERTKKAKAKLESVKVKIKAAILKASSNSLVNAKTTTYQSVSDVINSLEPEATADAALHPSVRALDLTASPLATTTAATSEPSLMADLDDSPVIFRLKPYQRSAINWMLEREMVYERKKAEQLKSLHENAAAIAAGTKQEETTISEGLEIRLEQIFDYDAANLDDVSPSLQRLGFLGRLIHDSRERYLPIITAHGQNVGVTVLGEDKLKYTASGDYEEKVVDVSDLIAKAIQRIEKYSITEAQIKDIKKDALRSRQEQQLVLTSRRAGKAPVSYVSEVQKEFVIAPVPSKGRKRPAAALASSSAVAETPPPIDKKSKGAVDTLPAGKKSKINPSTAALEASFSSFSAAVETVNNTDDEED